MRGEPGSANRLRLSLGPWLGHSVEEFARECVDEFPQVWVLFGLPAARELVEAIAAAADDVVERLRAGGWERVRGQGACAGIDDQAVVLEALERAVEPARLDVVRVRERQRIE